MSYTKKKCKSKISKWSKRLEECKDELIVGRWYRWDKYNNFIFMFNGEYGDSTEVTNKNYGINILGDWSEGVGVHDTKEYTLATDEEVQQALEKEAVNRGYRNGNYKCLDDPSKTRVFENPVYVLRQGSLFIKEGTYINVVFQNGIWAEIIEEPVYEYQWLVSESCHNNYKIATNSFYIDSCEASRDNRGNIYERIEKTKRIRK